MTLVPIFGRTLELQDLQQMFSNGRSFLVHGPAGVGKTLLVKHLEPEIPQMLYCRDSSSGQIAFRSLLAALFAKKNQRVMKVFGANSENAIGQKSAVAVRGIVDDALQEGRYWILLDHVQSPSQSFSGALKDLSNRTETPIVAVVRSAHMEDAGFLLPMFSDRSQKYSLRNFDPATATEFAAQVCREVQLHALNRDEVIEKIVAYSKGNPGAIVAMLQMATRSKYAAREHVKLAPLYIDFRLGQGTIYG
ncbi:MAG: ATP-binding protein [Candidatus Sulfotelmatobacter sp.]|jgi:hypothetical protein